MKSTAASVVLLLLLCAVSVKARNTRPIRALAQDPAIPPEATLSDTQSELTSASSGITTILPASEIPQADPAITGATSDTEPIAATARIEDTASVTADANATTTSKARRNSKKQQELAANSTATATTATKKWWGRPWNMYPSNPSSGGCTSCGTSPCGGGCGTTACGGGCGSPCGGCGSGCGGGCSTCGGGCLGRKLHASEGMLDEATKEVSALKKRVNELEQQQHEQTETIGALQHQLALVLEQLATIRAQAA